MVDPLAALLVFALLVLLGAVLLWPRRGLFPRSLTLLRQTERVRVEDALKHLYNCEYAGIRATVESVAGALSVSRAKALRLLARLDELGLARADAGGSSLTDGGRAYALRVVRTHRLWERYLADRTGVKAVDWHEHAERREHTLKASEAEDLAAELGHPLYDPHGDPIPTAEGEVPPRSGVALTSLRPGTRATVVHLEDEPKEVYERLVAEGLMPLMRIEVLGSESGMIRFRSGGQERTLEPVFASSVTVRPMRRGVALESQVRTLAELRVGEAAGVVGISQACQGPQRRRLLDLGVVPGTTVRAELLSPGGDPVAYEIRGALVALRREQASWIEVEDAADEE